MPRLRYTISVRDDRPSSKQAARRAQSNSAVASAACLEGAGARYPIYAPTEFRAKTARVVPHAVSPICITAT
jgi:hypothetical protein